MRQGCFRSFFRTNELLSGTTTPGYFDPEMIDSPDNAITDLLDRWSAIWYRTGSSSAPADNARTRIAVAVWILILRSVGALPSTRHRPSVPYSYASFRTFEGTPSPMRKSQPKD